MAEHKIYITKVKTDEPYPDTDLITATISVDNVTYEKTYLVTSEMCRYLPDKIKILNESVINLCKGFALEKDKDATFIYD